MLISLASSQANGFLRWSKNHPDPLLAGAPETACGSINEAEIRGFPRYAVDRARRAAVPRCGS